MQRIEKLLSGRSKTNDVSIRESDFESRTPKSGFIMKNVPNDTRIYEPIKLSDQAFFALLDTGAGRSFISEKLLNEIYK